MVVLVLNLVAHDSNGTVPARPSRVTYRRSRQGSAGTNLDQDAERISKQDIDGVVGPQTWAIIDALEDEGAIIDALEDERPVV